MFKKLGIGLLALLVLSSCNALRVTKPLEKGEHQVAASLGGPAIIFSGAPLPIPLSSVSYAYGLDTGLSVSTGLHTTSLMFGSIQWDASLHAELWRSQEERFGLMASPGVHLFYEFDEQQALAYPQIDLQAWWNYKEGSKNLLYGGLGTWVELYREKAHGQVQENELLPYAVIGHEFKRNTWSFQVEARYIGPFTPNNELVVTYLSPFNAGTSGLYFGVRKSFGR